MGSITKQLSRKDLAGKCQVMIRVTITRTNRPRFQTGIWVNPSHFSHGEVVIPKASKFNMEETEAAMKEKILVDQYCRRMEEILCATIGNTFNWHLYDNGKFRLHISKIKGTIHNGRFPLFF